MTPLCRRGVVIGVAITAACSTPSPPTELETILRNHAEARGGAAALDAIGSMLSEAVIVEPTFTVTGRYIAATDGRMRVDVFFEGNRGFSEGIDENGAWSWAGDAAAPVEASAIARSTLAHGVEFNLFGLHAFRRRGHHLELLGRKPIDGVSYHEIRVRLRAGFQTYRYLHPDNWMLERQRDTRALHPDVDPTETLIETENSDFRRVGEVISHFAWIERNVASGETLQEGRVEQLQYNPPQSLLNFPRNAAVVRPSA